MPSKLTLPEQRKLYNALPNSRKKALEKHCHSCEMNGSGIKEVLAKIKEVLGSVATELGPKVLKEIIVPLMLKYAKEKTGMTGKGLSLAGGSLKLAGGSLKLAGSGKKKMKKGSQEMKDHMKKIRDMRKK
jgi:hypothetical protein